MHECIPLAQVIELTREQERTKQAEMREKEAQMQAHAAQMNKVGGACILHVRMFMHTWLLVRACLL